MIFVKNRLLTCQPSISVFALGAKTSFDNDNTGTLQISPSNFAIESRIA